MRELSNVRILVGNHETVPRDVHTHRPKALLRDLTIVRDKRSSPAQVSTAAARVTGAVFNEASRYFPTQRCVVETPIGPHNGVEYRLPFTIFSPWRGSSTMEGPVVQLLDEERRASNVRVLHWGVERKHEESGEITVNEYYAKQFARAHEKPGVYLFVDPMFATGGTFDAGIVKLKEQLGINKTTDRTDVVIIVLFLIGAPKGVIELAQKHPDVQFVGAVLDGSIEEGGLNENGYIRGLGSSGIPIDGAGDLSDRVFGTT